MLAKGGPLLGRSEHDLNTSRIWWHRQGDAEGGCLPLTANRVTRDSPTAVEQPKVLGSRGSARAAAQLSPPFRSSRRHTRGPPWRHQFTTSRPRLADPRLDLGAGRVNPDAL